jgi:hypothetical protein
LSTCSAVHGQYINGNQANTPTSGSFGHGRYKGGVEGLAQHSPAHKLAHPVNTKPLSTQLHKLTVQLASQGAANKHTDTQPAAVRLRSDRAASERTCSKLWQQASTRLTAVGSVFTSVTTSSSCPFVPATPSRIMWSLVRVPVLSKQQVVICTQ